MYQTDFVKYLGQYYQRLRQEYNQFSAEKKESFYLKAFDVYTREKIKDDQTQHRFCSVELFVPGLRSYSLILEVNRFVCWRFYLWAPCDLQDSECASVVIASESFRMLVFAMFYITENIKLT